MAPSTSVQPDTPITIKITVDQEGRIHKKVKLAFSDLTSGLATLEQKLREFLSVPSTTPCYFERFSDSASHHVPLLHNNPSVYKQLLRAAKAKQKLKLRIVYPTVSPSAAAGPIDAEDLSRAAGPRPVTIEDVPEASSSASASSACSAPPKPPKMPVVVEPITEDRFAGNCLAIPGRFPLPAPPMDAIMEQAAANRLHIAADKTRHNYALPTVNTVRVGPPGDEMDSKVLPTTLKTASTVSAFETPEALAAAILGPQDIPSEIPQPIPVVKCTRHYTPDAWGYAYPDSDTSSTKQQPATTESVASSAYHPAFTVCCNSCERHIPDAHYHCSTCEEGDFDLCEDCIALGINCYSLEHWLIRRNIQHGMIVNSTTERIPPKSKSTKSSASSETAITTSLTEKPAEKATEKAAEKAPEVAVDAAKQPTELRYKLPERLARSASSRATASTSAKSALPAVISHLAKVQMRTCNNCIRELAEREFLHCSVCFDFDLCKECFAKNDHGHHPKHAFMPAVDGAEFAWNVTGRLSAGRGQRHNAVCDGCDTFITGVRHKCLNCPDWDYCSDCYLNADFIHPMHRFLPIYEPLAEPPFGNMNGSPPVVHAGIFCDGPLCAANGGCVSPIVGDRYKCAVCDNKDFCANCEASPGNTHNKTHPLLKFRTPVRRVSVTTTGEHDNGRPMPTMGDRRPRMFSNRATSTPAGAAEGSCLGAVQLNKAQTVLDIEPTVAEPSSSAASAVKPELATKSSDETLAEPEAQELGAVFQRDTISDGTVFAPNHVFEQTWVLRNTGSVAWPAGCCIRFVSGDYMGHVDPNHPARIQELVSASESTICYQPLAPGAEFPFTVLLRTPSRLGKVISYWRLTTKGGIKFGDRLWCDVDVRLKEEEGASTEKAISKEESAVAAEEQAESTEGSQMIFPKLEKESPVASIHEADAAVEALDLKPAGEHSEFEDWADDDSDAGFMTDEEYDILDASDEEYLAEEETKSLRK